ncbi:hypothetical protein [Deinococcus sp.]|uniref:hypothetical protein n=1 Tax=Deinococcus sp. TaxID=47478 RepID=UPI003CC54FF8
MEDYAVVEIDPHERQGLLNIRTGHVDQARFEGVFASYPASEWQLASSFSLDNNGITEKVVLIFQRRRA